jgi:ABC-type phosphate transport system substrate-binding protein
LAVLAGYPGRQQVAAIYSGKVTDWSDIGGAPGKIVVLFREPGALRSSFDSYFFPRGAPAYPATAIQLTTGDEVLRATASRIETSGMATIEAKAWPTSESASSRSTALLRPRKPPERCL